VQFVHQITSEQDLEQDDGPSGNTVDDAELTSQHALLEQAEASFSSTLVQGGSEGILIMESEIN